MCCILCAFTHSFPHFSALHLPLLHLRLLLSNSSFRFNQEFVGCVYVSGLSMWHDKNQVERLENCRIRLESRFSLDFTIFCVHSLIACILLKCLCELDSVSVSRSSCHLSLSRFIQVKLVKLSFCHQPFRTSRKKTYIGSCITNVEKTKKRVKKWKKREKERQKLIICLVFSSSSVYLMPLKYCIQTYPHSLVASFHAYILHYCG